MAGLIASKLTARAQTTIPPGVRKVLGVGPGDQLGYVIEGSEVRLVNPREDAHTDPALDPFLTLLQREITRHPERLKGFPASLLARIQQVSVGVLLDHDAPIDGAAAL